MNKAIGDKVFNEYYIKVVMVVMSLLYCIPFLMEFMDSLVNVVLLYCAMYIVYDLIVHRNILKTRNIVFAVLYLLSFCATIVMQQFQMLDIKVSIYLFMQLILFMSCASYKTKEDIQNEMHQFIHIVVFVGFVFCVTSLALYLVSFCEVFKTSVMDMELVIGKHPNSSLYGVMGNSNWYSFLLLTLIGLSLVELQTKNIHRKYYTWVMILSAISLCLTNSRGGLIGFIAFVFLYLLYCMWSNGNRNWKKYFLVPLVAIMMFPAASVVKIASNHVSNIVTSVINIGDGHTSANVGRNLKEQEASTSIRFTLWKTSAKVIMDNPILGVGNANVGSVMYQKTDDKVAINTKVLAANSHNIYIQIALISGLLGLALWLLYVLRNLWYVFIRLVMNQLPQDACRMIAILGCLTLAYMVINLVEADIFISRNFMSSLYWIILGYLVCYTQLCLGTDREHSGLMKYLKRNK